MQQCYISSGNLIDKPFYVSFLGHAVIGLE